MDSVVFNHHLPELHKVILESLTADRPVTFTNNYVKSHNGNVYNMVALTVGNDTIDLSVVYDHFFQVPVLYFRVNTALDYFSQYSELAVHLILDVPFLMVHPCETEAFIATTNPATPMDYLKSWFGINIQLVFPEILLRVKVKSEYL